MGGIILALFLVESVSNKVMQVGNYPGFFGMGSRRWWHLPRYSQSKPKRREDAWKSRIFVYVFFWWVLHGRLLSLSSIFRHVWSKDFGVFHFSHDSIVEHIRSQEMTSRFQAFTSLTSQIRRHTFAQTFFRWSQIPRLNKNTWKKKGLSGSVMLILQNTCTSCFL